MIAGELITADVAEIDRERQATLDMIYGIAYHTKIAEKDAIECPNELGRELLRNIAIEYKSLALMLHATTDGTYESQESMDTFYRLKADDCFKNQTKDVISKDYEQVVRETVGDVRYVLRYMEHYYISQSLSKVGSLNLRINLDNFAKMFGHISMVLERRESGDLDYLSRAMANWKTQCAASLDNPTIKL